MNALGLLAAMCSVGGCNYIFGVDPAPSGAPLDAAVDGTIDAPEIGCADGTREGFELALAPSIAGCGGGWSIPGVASPRSNMCAAAGNDSANPTGIECSAADLCAPGWHLCADRLDVAGHLPAPDTCSWTTSNDLEVAFFTSAQPASFSVCTVTGNDDLLGCGSLGDPPPTNSGCEPLARHSGNLCQALAGIGGWTCGMEYMDEAVNVTKAGASGGGALCCKDPRST